MLESILVWIVFSFIGAILFYTDWNLLKQLDTAPTQGQYRIQKWSFVGGLVLTVWYCWAVVVTLL